MTPLKITNLREIADRYDAFLVDQFGVLRDGRGAYDGAADALKELKAAGKTILILSNSGKRAADNDRRLAKIGFDPTTWNLFLTSGEVAFHMMQSGSILPPQARNVLLIARDGDTSAIDGLGFQQVANGTDADIVLITASEGDRFTLDHYRGLLGDAAQRKVPCLCTNPDMTMLTATGTSFGAGQIARLYGEMGGDVRMIGKPHKDMYDTALSMVSGIAPDRIVCIGDSVEHDIVGATQAGLASVLVTTGINAQKSSGELAQEFDQHLAIPDYIMPRFIW